MPIFAVQLRFIDNERRLEARPRHREYLAGLRDQGKLVTAGPWSDDTGALLLYDVADETELRRILADDPYPDDTIEIDSLREWRPLYPFSRE